jgi:hypothetical protein
MTNPNGFSDDDYFAVMGPRTRDEALEGEPQAAAARIAALERENAELRTLFQRSTEYLEELADSAAFDRSSIDVASILDFVRALRDDFEHKVTKPEEPR